MRVFEKKMFRKSLKEQAFGKWLASLWAMIFFLFFVAAGFSFVPGSFVTYV